MNQSPRIITVTPCSPKQEWGEHLVIPMEKLPKIYKISINQWQVSSDLTVSKVFKTSAKRTEQAALTQQTWSNSKEGS